jgi:predicted nucleotidyltransferase
MHEYFEIFYEATQAVNKENIPYVVGGGISVWAYGRQRETKDVDLFTVPENADKVLKVLSSIGFRTEHSDEKWIYKGFRGDAMVDIIFRNSRGVETDELMIKNGRLAKIDGYEFKIMSPEDLIFIKLISVIEDSPHWEDSYAIVKNNAGKIDWNYLLTRFKDEPRILLSFMLYMNSIMQKEIVSENMLKELTRKCNLG